MKDFRQASSPSAVDEDVGMSMPFQRLVAESAMDSPTIMPATTVSATGLPAETG